MRKLCILLLIIITVETFASFEDYFYNKTLRIDYIHAGSANHESYFLDEVKTEPYWGGSRVNLLDTFHYGQYFFKVFDSQSDSLLYSRGFSTLFGEWQTTDEAKNIERSFSETVVMPLPKNNTKIVLYSRDKEGVFQEKFVYNYKADNYFITSERRLEYPSFEVVIGTSSDKGIDIVVLPEGYIVSEMGKFIGDCKRFAQELFTFEPYKSYSSKFNIRGILAPSSESGNDIPADSIWKKSILSTTFYTFDSERYCMTYDNKSVRDLAANAPYDQIFILVNSEKYGGGAIYNYYSVSVNSNLHAAKIFIHEFGHGFAGLADEYYNSEVAYSEFYPTDIEPWEPNLTTLVDFKSKWKSMVEKDTPIPTPATETFLSKIGVFEGGGYAAKGVYRPAYDCLMNTFNNDEFCKVCQGAIEEMILFYSE